MPSLRLVVVICVIALCILVLVWQFWSNGPSLKDAQTFSDVLAYIEHEEKRHGLSPIPDHITKKNCAVLARIFQKCKMTENVEVVVQCHECKVSEVCTKLQFGLFRLGVTRFIIEHSHLRF